MVNLSNLYETIRPTPLTILTNQPSTIISVNCRRLTFFHHFFVVDAYQSLLVIFLWSLLAYFCQLFYGNYYRSIFVNCFSMIVIDQLLSTTSFFLSLFDFQWPLSPTFDYHFTVTVIDHLKLLFLMIVVELLSKFPLKNSLYI